MRRRTTKQFSLDDEPMTHHGGATELGHQRIGELLEGVAQDDHLVSGAKPVEELSGALERSEPGDHHLDHRHREAVLVEAVEATPHQHVVVGLVPRGPREGLDPGAFGDRDPDLGDQHPLEVEGDDPLSWVRAHSIARPYISPRGSEINSSRSPSGPVK